MKKLLTITLLLIATVTTQAQNMSFDETVKYINDKLAASTFRTTITATPDGIMKFDGKSINLFDLPQIIIDDKVIILQDKGIRLQTVNDSFWIYFVLSADGNELGLDSFDTEVAATRVYKAFIYLRSLCTKKKDPFDN